MKKLFLLLTTLALTITCLQNCALADEIFEANGTAIPCKVITVADGLIEYQTNGCTYKFTRSGEQEIFHDYVDVRTDIKINPIITRYTGKILFKDFGGVKILTDQGRMDIPWWRVKFVGIYKP